MESDKWQKQTESLKAEVVELKEKYN